MPELTSTGASNDETDFFSICDRLSQRARFPRTIPVGTHWSGRQAGVRREHLEDLRFPIFPRPDTVAVVSLYPM